MLDESRIGQAARFLFEEHQDRKPFRPIPPACAARTVAEAYAIQEAFRDLMTVTHGPVAGYKIALTTPVMQKMVGVHEPVSGGILAKTIHQSPCTTRCADYGHLGVECEIAVRLNADLPASQAPFSRSQVAEAIGALMVAFELIDDRHVDYSQIASHVLSVIADNVANAGIVLGPPASGWLAVDLGAARGTMFINDTVAGEGHGRDVMGHPLDALAWLANMLAQRGKTLAQGTVVMTGSIIATKFVSPGDTVRFGVEGLGEVHLSIT